MSDEHTLKVASLSLKEAESVCEVDARQAITSARDCIFAILECLSQPRINWEAARKYAISAEDNVRKLSFLCSYPASVKRNEGTVRDEAR